APRRRPRAGGRRPRLQWPRVGPLGLGLVAVERAHHEQRSALRTRPGGGQGGAGGCMARPLGVATAPAGNFKRLDAQDSARARDSEQARHSEPASNPKQNRHTRQNRPTEQNRQTDRDRQTNLYASARYG